MSKTKRQLIVIDSHGDYYNYDLRTEITETLGLTAREMFFLQGGGLEQLFDDKKDRLLADTVVVICSSFRAQFEVANTLGRRILKRCPHASMCGLSGLGNQFDQEVFEDFIERDFSLSHNPEKFLEFLRRAFALEPATT